LAEKCGFSSRSSFFRAIKKHTGKTPAEFLKKTK
jgi:AraC-like DNA-binding protein